MLKSFDIFNFDLLMIKLKTPYTFSIIFYPKDQTLNAVKNLKSNLTSQINDYASQNSLAHITIAGFEANESQLLGVSEYLTKFVKNEVAFTALFNQFSCSTFSKGAVFLPSGNYKSRIHTITKKVRKMISITKMSVISNPHVSIGRELSEEQLNVAHEMFNDESFEFECCQIALREFNTERGQYDIKETFTFTGKINKSVQLPLDF